MAVSNELLNDVKTSMRIKHNALDADFINKIQTALDEMERTGVQIPAEIHTSTDRLIVTGCELYTKWMSDFEGKGERYQKNFEQLRDTLSMSSEYNGADNNV